MARTYHAEYERRQQRALERGFTSYHEERQFRAENAGILNASIVRETLAALFPNTTLGPQQLVGLWEVLGDYLMSGGEEITGAMRHELVQFFIDQGMDTTQAVHEMREILGTSP